MSPADINGDGAAEYATHQEDLDQIAERLAKDNAAAEPNITEIYLFPHLTEIRLIELDESTIPSERVVPYYFPPAPRSGITAPSGIAFILPEEKGTLEPPEGWGSWDQARRIWKREPSNGS